MIAESKNITQHFLFQVIYWLAGIGAMVMTIAGIISQPEQTMVVLGLLVFFFLALKNQRFGMYVVMLVPLVGELVRLPIGPANGILISDAVIPLLVLSWIITNIRGKHSSMPRMKLAFPFLLFIVVAGLSLLQSLIFLSVSEVMSGSLYLIRFLQYGFLYFITLQTVETEAQVRTFLKVLTASALLLAVAGFIQLMIYPDLAALEEQGYDPHINRLVSTWLDPNFVGGFLAFVITLLLGITLHAKKNSNKFWLLCIIALLGAALFLTYSRSAYLALAAGIFIVSLLQSRKILIIALTLFLVGLALSPRAQERVGELAQSVTSLISSSADTPDPTAKLRLQSWGQTWQIIQKRPLLGSGYNNLRAINYQEGFIKEEDVHSGSGSDSSLLTILAATGILGLTPFMLLYFIPLKTAFTVWRNKKKSPLTRGYGLGIVGGVIALFIHSVFVNSLLFPSILLFTWISFGLLEVLNGKAYTQSLSGTEANRHNSGW